MTTGPIALVFKLNNGLVTSVLDGLSDDEVWRRPAGAANPIGWLVGHVTGTRAAILQELGAPFDPGFSGMFMRGEELKGPCAYPSRAAIERAWKESHGRMRDAFAPLDEAWLAAPSRGKPLPGVKTMGDRLGFFAFHESYHVGQMAYARRLLGHSGVAG